MAEGRRHVVPHEAAWRIRVLGGLREGEPGLAGSGTAAASPTAHTSSKPATRMWASVGIRPWSSVGRPSFATAGAAMIPAVQARVWVAIVVPSERWTSVSPTPSTRTPVRTSMPRRSSSRRVNSASGAGTSRMMRASLSTTSQRIPAAAQRG